MEKKKRGRPRKIDIELPELTENYNLNNIEETVENKDSNINKPEESKKLPQKIAGRRSTYKCKVCHDSFRLSELITTNSGNYCNKCYQEKIAKKERDKINRELKAEEDKKKKQEKKERDALNKEKEKIKKQKEKLEKAKKNKVFSNDGLENKEYKCSRCQRFFFKDNIVSNNKVFYCLDCHSQVYGTPEINKNINDILYKIAMVIEDGDESKAGYKIAFFNRQINFLTQKNLDWDKEKVYMVLKYIWENDNIDKTRIGYSITYQIEAHYGAALDYQKTLDKIEENQEENEKLLKDSGYVDIKIMGYSENYYSEKQKNLLYGKPIDLDEIDDNLLAKEVIQLQKTKKGKNNL